MARRQLTSVARAEFDAAFAADCLAQLRVRGPRAVALLMAGSAVVSVAVLAAGVLTGPGMRSWGTEELSVFLGAWAVTILVATATTVSWQRAGPRAARMFGFVGLIATWAASLVVVSLAFPAFVWHWTWRTEAGSALSIAWLIGFWCGPLYVPVSRQQASRSVLWFAAIVVVLIATWGLLARRPDLDPSALRNMAGGVGAGAGLVLLLGPSVFIAGGAFERRLRRAEMAFLDDRYGPVSRELVDARRLHESLFPAPIDNGPVRAEFMYEPMRHIGGDFLFLRQGPAARLALVVLDVTGHGIAAAMAVNRLHGELERLFAEEPEIAPGRVLALLNRYLCLTMSRHSIFATAACAVIDPCAGSLRFASAGHPTCFLLRSSGELVELQSTAMMLGVAEGTGALDEHQHDLAPGETILAYTDGVIETRTSGGRLLGTQGLRSLLERCPAAGRARWLLDTVRDLREGQAEDDLLVVAASLA